MSKPFCNLINHQYHITYDVVKPCCWIKNNSASILDEKAIKEQTDRLLQVTDWIPDCDYCHTLEKSGMNSPRLISLNNPLYNNASGTIKVEVQIDEECNAACLMCGPTNSTTWQQYTNKTVKNKTIQFTPSISVDNRFETVKQIVNFDNIRTINFFGGEPLRTRTHIRVLELIKNPENVELVYVTNGSVAPDAELLDLWDRFKFIHINISIDGIDEHFNYLRWPLQWKQVKENLKEYAKLDPKKFKVDTSFIVTPFNILYHDRYTDWASNFFAGTNIVGEKLFQSPWPVVGIINLECIPDKLKQAVLNKFGKDSKMAKLILPFNQTKYQKFMDYVALHDQHRNLFWQDVFPEIKDYLSLTGT
jgi:sulfatase maturation enzyme AslB (radical SAM superfamily)